MTTFTVETVMAPITGGDWTELRRLTDILPGTILIEDADEPMLVIPVDAESQRSAAVFVQGAMSVLGHEVKWGRAYLAEPCELDYRSSEDTPVAQPDIAPSWLEDSAATKRFRESVYA